MKNMSKIKKILLVTSLLLVAIVIVACVMLLQNGEVDGGTPIGSADDYLYRYSEDPVDYDLIFIDTETDILSYAPYLECDRNLYYTTNNTTVSYSIAEALERTDDVRFFAEYFRTLMDADYGAHADLFSDAEFYQQSMPARFSRQMVHGMEVEYLGELNGATYYCVTVEIFESDGTYLRHMADGGSRSLWFETVKVNGEMKIQAIYVSSLAILALAGGT